MRLSYISRALSKVQAVLTSFASTVFGANTLRNVLLRHITIIANNTTFWKLSVFTSFFFEEDKGESELGASIPMCSYSPTSYWVVG
uniref:Secreted protein n=1 Tax=Steinernema glaseri TaxID=37863 RepID=A0A1I7ZLL6_9BILA